ncbi:MAG: patatin-like phospholipase family protein, partial [Candidatus Baltobacteraceae bacterium]
LNAFLVATAQYRLLRELWQGVISSRNVFRLKHPFEKITDPEAGLANRLDAGLRLGRGLATDLTGVLDPAPVRALLAEYIRADAPVHLPLYVSTTNLTRHMNQDFHLNATTPVGAQKQALNDALLQNYPVLTRLAGGDILHDVFFASACLPMMFEPIVIPRDDGSGRSDQYVDGGVTSNVPVRIAQICVEFVHVVLLYPKANPDVHYESGVDVGMGVFETMQANIIEYQVRLAYAAAEKKLPFLPFVIRPQTGLPGKAADFNDQPALTAMWQLGYEDGKRGWVPFAPPAGAFSTPY